MSTAKLLEAYETIRQAGVSDFFARTMVDMNAESLSQAGDPKKIASFLAAEAPDEYFEGGKRPQPDLKASRVARADLMEERRLDPLYII